MFHPPFWHTIRFMHRLIQTKLIFPSKSRLQWLSLHLNPLLKKYKNMRPRTCHTAIGAGTAYAARARGQGGKGRTTRRRTSKSKGTRGQKALEFWQGESFVLCCTACSPAAQQSYSSPARWPDGDGKGCRLCSLNLTMAGRMGGLALAIRWRPARRMSGHRP